jgi:hypothetical protein
MISSHLIDAVLGGGGGGGGRPPPGQRAAAGREEKALIHRHLRVYQAVLTHASATEAEITTTQRLSVRRDQQAQRHGQHCNPPALASLLFRAHP